MYTDQLNSLQHKAANATPATTLANNNNANVEALQKKISELQAELESRMNDCKTNHLPTIQQLKEQIETLIQKLREIPPPPPVPPPAQLPAASIRLVVQSVMNSVYVSMREQLSAITNRPLQSDEVVALLAQTLRAKTLEALQAENNNSGDSSPAPRKASSSTSSSSSSNSTSNSTSSSTITSTISMQQPPPAPEPPKTDPQPSPSPALPTQPQQQTVQSLSPAILQQPSTPQPTPQPSAQARSLFTAPPASQQQQENNDDEDFEDEFRSWAATKGRKLF